MALTWKQSLLSLVLAVLWLAVTASSAAEPILCSRCNSDEYPECETNPPSPTRCHVSGSRKQNCIVAQEIKNDNIMKFIRDCTTSSFGYKCEPVPKELQTPQSPDKICYRTCDYDGCNAAPTPAPALSAMAAIALVPVLLQVML